MLSERAPNWCWRSPDNGCLSFSIRRSRDFSYEAKDATRPFRKDGSCGWFLMSSSMGTLYQIGSLDGIPHWHQTIAIKRFYHPVVSDHQVRRGARQSIPSSNDKLGTHLFRRIEGLQNPRFGQSRTQDRPRARIDRGVFRCMRWHHQSAWCAGPASLCNVTSGNLIGACA